MNCIKCNEYMEANKSYNGYCRTCWWEIQDKPHLINKVSRKGSDASSYIDGRWVNNKDNYMVEYMRTNQIWNKFTGKHEKYTGEPCPSGLVRHHEYYNLNNINDGVVFITSSEHMKIHQAIRFGREPKIQIFGEIK